MSFPLTVTVTSMSTTPQFCFINDHHRHQTQLQYHSNHSPKNEIDEIIGLDRQDIENVDEDFIQMRNSNNSKTTTSFSNSYSNHYHQRQMNIMISPPPPLSLSPNRQMICANAPHSPVLSIESSSGRSMPMRKQSVFVAPSDLSLRTQSVNYPDAANSFVTPSKEEISQRITKLIQENSAIVEANNPISNNCSTSNSNYHQRSQYSANTQSDHLIANNYDKLQHPITMSTKLCHPLRRHSSSADNPHFQTQQQSFVIIHPDDLNSDFNLDTSTLVSTNSSISKLQSALLGANATELRHYNRPHYSNSSYSTLPYNLNQQSSFTTKNSSIESLNSLHPNLVISQHQIIRKYSENILSSRSQYANIASAIQANTPFVFGSNSHRSISSETCLFPSLYTQQHSFSNQPQSVIISREKDLTTNPSFYFSSSSSSESSDPKSCLVRNLLLSGTSSTTLSYGNNLITSSSNSNHRQEGVSTTMTSHTINSLGNALDVSTTDQSCIIKDLLLKTSKHGSLPIGTNTNNSQQSKLIISNNEPSMSPNSSRKRSRLSTSSNSSEVQIVNQLEHQNGQPQKSQINQQANQQVYTCQLCLVQFRNEQNLEIHRKYYCCGQHPSQQQSLPVPPSTFGHIHRSIPKPQMENKTINLARERKVSVLERPSIIAYNTNSYKNHLNNLVTTTTTTTTTISLTDNNYSTDFTRSEIQDERKNTTMSHKTSAQYNFGNILKTKLLSGGYDPESELLNYGDFQSDYLNNWPSSSSALLKKRKISEPAYRFQYLSQNEFKNVNNIKQEQSRTSVIQSNSFIRSQPKDESKQTELEQFQLEIIQAYMPYLIRPPKKITLIGPVIFPVLQKLLDTCTNYEFVLESRLSSGHNLNTFVSSCQNSKTQITDNKLLVEKKPEFETTSDTEEIVDLLNDLFLTLEMRKIKSEIDQELICEIVDDLIDAIVLGKNHLEPKEEKFFLPQRPTTLAIKNTYLNQDYDDQKVSIYFNKCSLQRKDFLAANKQSDLIPSTLVSPDAPRSKRKYQQLSLNGNAYSNLGLKVSLRSTYCCIYRLQPMFVTQEANPQLSMYSQWTTQPIPEGDILETLKSPLQLLSAYNSQEAVFIHSNNQTRSTFKPQQQQLSSDPNNHINCFENNLNQIILEKVEPRAESLTCSIKKSLIKEFLFRSKARLNHILESTTKFDTDETSTSEQKFQSKTTIIPDRTLKADIWSNGNGLNDRISYTCTKLHFLSTHSNYQYQFFTPVINSGNLLSNKSRNQQKSSINRNSFENSNSFYHTRKNSMGLCSSPETPIVASPLVGPGKQLICQTRHCRKRSSTSSNSQSSLSFSSTAFNPLLTMHPMLGHLPNKSQQKVMYIMMMQQKSPLLSVPSVSNIMANATKDLAFRKFSDCIGLKQSQTPVYDAEHGWRFASTGQDSSAAGLMPKRIKIFEGGFKSNEDYTYIRGRGRGKYICGECGIRCKKPSMLKKHIRTHTDLRPYSCRYCAFAFKTKGNLTKHMKSKAHHKKCVELGIVPVPISIDDSQIDLEALTKQEQYELCCNSNSDQGSLSGGAINCEDDDDEYDDEDGDEEDDDDEGMPIPIIENRPRLIYIEPGQFDDVPDKDITDEPKNQNYKRKLSNETITLTNLSSLEKISPSINNCLQTELSPATTNGDAENADYHQKMNFKNRLIMPLTNTSSSTTISISTTSVKSSLNHKLLINGNTTMVNSVTSNVDTSSLKLSPESLPTNQKIKLTTDTNQLLTNTATSSITSSTTAKDENEVEAVQSLLILSAGPEQQNGGFELLNDHIDLNYSQMSLAPAKTSLVDAMSSVTNKRNSNLPIVISNSNHHQFNTLKEINCEKQASTIVDNENNISKELNLNPIPLQLSATNGNYNNNNVPHHRHSHPTSVIIANHQSSINSSSEIVYNTYKRTRTISASSNHGITNNFQQGPTTVTSKLTSKCATNLHSITTLITTTTPTLTTTTNNLKHQKQILLEKTGQTLNTQNLIPTLINDNNNNLSVEQKLLQNYSTGGSDIPPLKSYSSPHYSAPIFHSPSPVSSSKDLLINYAPNYHQNQETQFMNNRTTHLNQHQQIRNMSPCLPSIMDQLNSFVKSKAPTLSSTPVQKIISQPADQEQPIDLSAKKPTFLVEPTLSNRPKANDHLLEESINSSISKSTPQIVKQSINFDKQKVYDNIMPPLNHNSIIKGHQLYQNVRSEEFAHLAPGVHTPHSLPRNVQNMLNNRNDERLNISSLSNPSSSSSSTLTPTKTVINNKTFPEILGKSTCPTCMKQFSKPEQLSLHFKIHSFERLFRCEPCAVSFRTKGHLQKHTRSVSHINKLNMSITFGRPSSDNPRPFKCSDCKIAFRIHGHLAKHLRAKMHIMKLECLGKLPFGMFAEMERNNINFSQIDTTDCVKALETLQALAQKLYDPRQVCWKDMSSLVENGATANQDDSDLPIIEEDIDVIEDLDDSLSEDHQEDEEDQSKTIMKTKAKSSNDQTREIIKTPITNTSSSTTISKNGNITSTRSNTCYLCGQVFKGVKFLQVHLYCEHPELMGNVHNNSSPDTTTAKV